MTDHRVAYYATVDTDFGSMLVAGNGRTLVAIKFAVPPKRTNAAVEALHDELHGYFTLIHDETKVANIAKQVSDYLTSRRKAFDLDLDLCHVTSFRRDVLLETARVPRGQVASYAEIARRVGRPLACRAVGSTMRTNPVPLVVPCHRIVASDGGVGGFGGGLDMKRRLLALEGVALAV